ncbi:serine/threonine-protein phosphatase 6 regulatory ankyrin repeat subunit B [Conger conger]|uniref:serine/threonine-protein phosphatase 6 regulatory ankyrin repeat subunit B n=1 Tax=Conger conger TaxID=82655 RepID=UPI002A5AFF82|nr:serine/threonine-protein phosphatase 6 regulatory ankyrin repeat subunit B [Conger conger]
MAVLKLIDQGLGRGKPSPCRPGLENSGCSKIFLAVLAGTLFEISRAHACVCVGVFRCLEFLLQSGATASLKDKQGYSAVHYAAAYGHRHCLELLLDQDEAPLEDPGSPNTRSPLHLAAYHGHAPALEVLLQGERDVDQGDEAGRTPLALAALRGHSDCVHTLLSQGASPRARDSARKRTPVHLAVMNGHTSCLRLLLEDSDSADLLEAADAQGQTPLMLAVAGGHVDVVSVLLEREAAVDTADRHGLTALHLGLLCGQEESVQCLLEQEASVLLGDHRGRTSLHLAAARGHASWLSELLNIAFAEPPAPLLRDRAGYTPLHWACYNGHEGCVEVLLEHKAIGSFEGNPFSPLHCAVVNDHEACASVLLEAMGSDIVNCRDAKDRTPLHAAAFSGHVDCLQLLLAHDAPVDAVDQSGRSALMMSSERGCAGAVEVLLRSVNADVSLSDQNGNTALHLACSNGKEECALLILEKLTDPTLVSSTNKALQTPLHLAARSGLKQVVQELLTRGASVQAQDENGLTPALACAPSSEVADCLALILGPMMPLCSPCSSGGPSPRALLKTPPPRGRGHREGRATRVPSATPSEGDGTTENDSDSETF